MGLKIEFSADEARNLKVLQIFESIVFFEIFEIVLEVTMRIPMFA